MIYYNIELPDKSILTLVLEYNHRHLLGPIEDLLLGELEETVFTKILNYPNDNDIKIYCFFTPDVLKKYSIFEELTPKQIEEITINIAYTAPRIKELVIMTTACLIDILNYHNTEEDKKAFLLEILLWYREQLGIIDKKLVEL